MAVRPRTGASVTFEIDHHVGLKHISTYITAKKRRFAALMVASAHSNLARMSKTGIEIHIGISEGQRIVGKLLHTLHLDKLTQLIAKVSKAHIKVDGGAPMIDSTPDSRSVPRVANRGRQGGLRAVHWDYSESVNYRIFGWGKI